LVLKEEAPTVHVLYVEELPIVCDPRCIFN